MSRRIGLTARGRPTEPAAIAGTRAEIAVPPPGSDSIASEPATRATRWRIPVRPKPSPVRGARAPGTMNPTPSSRTSRVTTSPMNDRVSPARVAPACFATLVSASWAVRSSATSISGWRLDDLAGDRDVDRDPAELRPLASHDREGVGQRPRFERGRHRRLDRPPGLGQALAGEPLRVLDVAIAVGRPILAHGRPLRAG